MKNSNNLVQNQIAKESIFTALMILMDQKKFTEITVTEVTRRAGVSRMAFYRNYDQLEDIITNFLEEYFQTCSKQLINKSFDNYEGVLLYFASFRKQKNLIINLINSNLSDLIYKSSVEFFQSFSEHIICNRNPSYIQSAYHTEYIIGGLYRVLIKWAQNGMVESDEDIAKMISHLMVSSTPVFSILPTANT